MWGIPLRRGRDQQAGRRFGPQAIRRASAIMDNDPQYPFNDDFINRLAIVDTATAFSTTATTRRRRRHDRARGDQDPAVGAPSS